ncbi:MAG: polysaccharide deacetylase family protein [Coriobacteriia bacterium]|nr:polysaccharide deacetylase family protein [Coriobacteriia bacterium]
MKSLSRKRMQVVVLLLAVGAVLVTAGCLRVLGSSSQKAEDPQSLSSSGMDSHKSSKEAPAEAPVAPVAVMPAPFAAFSSVPLTSSVGPSASIGVPILMYHEFGTPQKASDSELFTRQNDFVAQLRYLQSNGYHAVTLQQVYDCWYGKGTLPSKPVVISIDDGNDSAFMFAAPLLKSMGWPAVLNMITGDKPGATRMEASKIRALIADGWEIDSHSVTHPDLNKISASQLTHELTESRRLLQEQFGVPVNFFCYPSGKYDATTVAAVRAAGYLGATTCNKGIAKSADPYRLTRVYVSGGMTMTTFAASLR